MASILDRVCRFLERAERSPLTRRAYRSDLEGMARWFEGQNGDPFSPSKITPTDLRNYKRWLTSQDLKPATINRKLATLKSFLHWAVDVRLLRNGHGLRVLQAIREARRDPRWLDRREQHRLLRAVEQAGKGRDVAAVTLMLNTGLRVAEFCAVNWKDIRLSDRQGTLTVRKGKGSKRRQIPLNKDARHVLLSLGYGEHAGKATPIFVGQRGTRLSDSPCPLRAGGRPKRRHATFAEAQLLQEPRQCGRQFREDRRPGRSREPGDHTQVLRTVITGLATSRRNGRRGRVTESIACISYVRFCRNLCAIPASRAKPAAPRFRLFISSFSLWSFRCRVSRQSMGSFDGQQTYWYSLQICVRDPVVVVHEVRIWLNRLVPNKRPA